MKKMERLVGIIYALKEHEQLTAKQISDLFEVSERTIYRDIEALSQLNIPIISLEGFGGGYQIDDNYFIPSVAFNEKEILYLLMSLRLGEIIKVPNMQEDYVSLKYKLLNILDNNKKEKYLTLLEKITFFINDIFPGSYKKDVIQIIIDSFLEYKNIVIQYYSPKTNVLIEREVTPYQLFYDSGGWYINSFCHLRKQDRCFRLDRIKEISISENTYSSTLLDELMQNKKQGQDDKINVTLSMDKSLYETVKHDYMFLDSVVKDCGNIVTLQFWAYVDDIIRLSITNIDEVTIIEPPMLISQLSEKCQQIMKKYKQH
ncbi:YafY family protein [Bacillus sp. SM2101]|uniref:helix-turn-helix transcriptional regulator n=1 Tax=Bacillus sp. SM2101 TaxID=2805366 RepID=UPI001BDEA6B9|nr:YafY family protein [Bacillus sp. SM2101]